MIKDVMVRLDGTSGDDVRLAAVNQIADIFESHITGLFFNVLSSIVPDGRAGVGQAGKLLDTAKQAGDIIEATVFERLTRLRTSIGFSLLVGNEVLYLRGRSAGADGIVSGVAAALPELLVAMEHPRGYQHI